MMQKVRDAFLIFIKKCKTWYCHFILSEATEEETNEWYEEQERERAEYAEEERQRREEEAKWFADYQRENAEVENSNLPDDDLIGLVQELPDEEDRSRCPLCGTHWTYYGKCKSCDRAFGHD